MEQNAHKPCYTSQKEDNMFIETKFFSNASEQILEEKFLNNFEPEYEQKQISKMLSPVIETSVSRNFRECLNEEMCQIISDFCSPKLIQVIKSSIDYMKSSHRSKFTVEDFYRGLYANGEETLLVTKLPRIKESTDDSNHKVAVCTKSSKSSKLASTNFNRRTKRKRENHVSNTEETNVSKNILISSKWLYDNPFSENLGNLPPELNKYFNVVTKCLLNKDENTCLKILHDFKTNRSISNLVPHFVKFFSCYLNNLNQDYLRISIFLKSLHSLLLNSYLYLNLKVLSNGLAHTIANFLLSDLPLSSDAWDYSLLKDTAACLLVQVINRSESQELFFEIVYSLKSTFSDLQKSLESHYGAVRGLNSLGVPAIMLGISPYVSNYSKYLNNVYESDNCRRHIISMIQGQLIHAYYLLICHCFKYEFFNSYTLSIEHYPYFPFYYLEFFKNNKVYPFLSQLRMEDIYGDRLVQYFPLLNFVSFNVNYNINNLNLKHSLDEENSLKKPPSISSESPSTFTIVSKNNLIKNTKKSVRLLHLKKKGSSLMTELAEKNSDHISKVCTVKSQCMKNSFKESSEQIFENVPLKKHVIKFGKFIRSTY